MMAAMVKPVMLAAPDVEFMQLYRIEYTEKVEERGARGREALEEEEELTDMTLGRSRNRKRCQRSRVKNLAIL